MMKFEVGKIYKDHYEMGFTIMAIWTGKYPIVARNEFSEEVRTYTADGQYDIDQPSMSDLRLEIPVEIKEKLEYTNEALYILQEECAEVTQAVSKVLRFRWDAVNPVIDSNQTNKEHLEEELGDLLAMIDIVTGKYNLSSESIQEAKENKIKKLKTWSNIFN